MTDDGATWSVQVAPATIRALERLPHKIAAAIAEFVTATLPTDPYGMSKPLRFEFEGWWVARRGNYRVMFRLLEDDRVLYVGRSSTAPTRTGLPNALMLGRRDRPTRCNGRHVTKQARSASVALAHKRIRLQRCQVASQPCARSVVTEEAITHPAHWAVL